MAPRIANPVLFICDLQEKFRPAIHEFPKVVATAQKLLRATQVYNIPIVATTQNRARLGETCPELLLDVPNGYSTLCHADKTRFSMVIPELTHALATHFPSPQHPLSCILLGIESHICITHTALDLLARGHSVYLLADAVSSCNSEEVPIALARLRHAGAVVTTSESLLYELVGDAEGDEFKQIIKIVKDTSGATKDALSALCKM